MAALKIWEIFPASICFMLNLTCKNPEYCFVYNRRWKNGLSFCNLYSFGIIVLVFLPSVAVLVFGTSLCVKNYLRNRSMAMKTGKLEPSIFGDAFFPKTDKHMFQPGGDTEFNIRYRSRAVNTFDAV